MPRRAVGLALRPRAGYISRAARRAAPGGEKVNEVEISASLFDIEEAAQVSRERVEQLKEEILRRYQEQTRASEEPDPREAPAERKEQSG